MSKDHVLSGEAVDYYRHRAGLAFDGLGARAYPDMHRTESAGIRARRRARSLVTLVTAAEAHALALALGVETSDIALSPDEVKRALGAKEVTWLGWTS